MSVAELIGRATDARTRAYAPYSGYAVGAAVEAEDGRVWTGSNIENVSYGATMCAERVALFTMVASGEHRLRRVAVVTQDGGTPCGMCLQALLEFAPDPAAVEVVVADAAGGSRVFSLAQLLPFGFRSSAVERTE
jgi:cytidine deaminase